MLSLLTQLDIHGNFLHAILGCMLNTFASAAQFGKKRLDDIAVTEDYQALHDGLSSQQAMPAHMHVVSCTYQQALHAAVAPGWVRDAVPPKPTRHVKSRYDSKTRALLARTATESADCDN